MTKPRQPYLKRTKKVKDKAVHFVFALCEWTVWRPLSRYKEREKQEICFVQVGQAWYDYSWTTKAFDPGTHVDQDHREAGRIANEKLAVGSIGNWSKKLRAGQM